VLVHKERLVLIAAALISAHWLSRRVVGSGKGLGHQGPTTT
jgi:hypothetical protein